MAIEAIPDAATTVDELVEGLLATGGGATAQPKPQDAAAPGAAPAPGEGDGVDDAADWDLPDGEQPEDPPPEDAAADSGEGDDDAQATGQQEPFYTVTIDGKQERVALSEALAGYQRQADYTRKTQEVAELRKQAEAETAAVRASRQQYDDVLKGLQGQLDGVKEPTPEQWDRLKGENPEQYAVQYADFQRRQNARDALKAERARVQDQARQDALKQFGELRDKERGKLLEKMASWQDPEKYKAGAKQVFDFVAKQYGFSDQEVGTTIDHRVILMAEDARKYHAIMARRAEAQKKVGNAPVVPPRGRAPVQNRKAAADKEARQRLEQTGRIDDAMSLILSR
jgi:hypothetical protein